MAFDNRIITDNCSIQIIITIDNEKKNFKVRSKV